VLANFSPRVGAQRQPWVLHDYVRNAESVGEAVRVANAFSVRLVCGIETQGCSNPELELANAFGVVTFGAAT